MTKDKCTQEQFEAVHAAVDSTRKGSQFVKVPREALVNLLLDHTRLQTDRKGITS